MFDTSCQRFWIHITKIVSHIHKNTVIGDEHIVSLQSSVQFPPRRLPVIVWQRVKEQFPVFIVTMVTAMCLCADKRIESCYFKDLYGPVDKMFLGILGPLSFSVVSF
jgi:hypothetical protein